MWVILLVITFWFSFRNIVATVNLDCRLDLKTIALHARNAEYNPKVTSLLSFFTLYLSSSFWIDRMSQRIEETCSGIEVVF